jgi:hypothetical protein
VPTAVLHIVLRTVEESSEAAAASRVVEDELVPHHAVT